MKTELKNYDQFTTLKDYDPASIILRERKDCVDYTQSDINVELESFKVCCYASMTKKRLSGL